MKGLAMRYVFCVVVCVGSAFIGGCADSGNGGGQTPECVPGKVDPCPCEVVGETGLKVCNDFGLWRDCQCTAIIPGDSATSSSTDSGTDSVAKNDDTDGTDATDSSRDSHSDGDTATETDVLPDTGTDVDSVTAVDPVSTDDTGLGTDDSENADSDTNTGLSTDTHRDSETVTESDQLTGTDSATVSDVQPDTETETGTGTETDILCTGCVIEDVCYPDGALRDGNVCEGCDAAVSSTSWTLWSGISCNDGIFCNGEDICNAGACSGHAGNPCDALQTCDPVADTCCSPDVTRTCNSDGDVVSYDSCGNSMGVVEDCIASTSHGNCIDGACGCAGNWTGISCDVCAEGWVGADCDECIVYVDAATGNDGDSGFSWELAKATVQAGIDTAALTGCAVWVAAGTYYPTALIANQGSTERHLTIQMAEGVDMYGGFQFGDSQVSQRDIAANETILSGDVDLDGTIDGNVYRIVAGADNAVLDGFSIVASNSKGGQRWWELDGGGMLNDGASPTVRNCIFEGHVGGDSSTATLGVGLTNINGSRAIVQDCVFRNNVVEGGSAIGVAVGNSDSSPVFENCIFENNGGSDVSGAAMVGFNNANVTVRDCTFRKNTADGGGAIWTYMSTMTIENSEFILNRSSSDGAAVHSYMSSSITVVNSVFANNLSLSMAGTTGGVLSSSAESSLTVTNCTLFGNLDGKNGTGGVSVVDIDASLVFRNNLVWNGAVTSGGSLFVLESGGTQTIEYNNIDGYCTPGTNCMAGNINQLPQLVNAPENVFRTTGAEAANTLAVTGVATDLIAFVGDIIEIEDDGVPRTITALTTDTITFSPAWDEETAPGMHVSNWKDNSNVTLDLHLKSDSPCIDAANGNVAPADDFDGMPREDDPETPNTGIGTPVADMGAFEYVDDGSGDTETGDTETGDTDTGSNCASGFFDDDGNPLTPCVAWQDCAPGTFVSAPGSATTDRECTVCPLNQTSAGTNATDCVDVQFSALAGSVGRTCGIRSHDGIIQCWGFNYYGQSEPPSDVAFSQLSVGGGRTCGLRADNGEALCFGEIFANTPVTLAGVVFSRLDVWDVMACGIVSGGPDDGLIRCFGGTSDTPPGFPTDTAFRKVEMGFRFNCGIQAADDEVFCAGDDPDVPGLTPSGVAFSDISAGYAHVCGIRSADNMVQCWGNNDYGQTEAPETTPFASVYTGMDHACGLMDDGEAICWGNNDRGQTDVPSGISFRMLALGDQQTCGIIDAGNAGNGGEDDGKVICWGGDEYGGAAPPSSVPRDDISSNWYLTCARADTGTGLGNAMCFGDSSAANTPTDTLFATVSVGEYHACGIDGAGAVECWGRNEAGEGSPPVGVDFSALAAGEFFTCGIVDGGTDDGKALCFGDAEARQLNTVPATPLSQLTAGQRFACGITAAAPVGEVTCWGDNSDVISTQPDGTAFDQISAGAVHVCGIMSNVATVGNVHCWGTNTRGQLNAPDDVYFSKVTSGAYHSCGIVSGGADDGKVECWGYDDYHQSQPPADVRFTDVAGGLLHTCGIRESDGVEVCWGAWVRNLWQ